MAWSTSIAGKCCAACANWGGPRKVNSLKRAETDRSDTKGKCYLGVGTCSAGTNACYGCNKFEPWVALK